MLTLTFRHCPLPRDRQVRNPIENRVKSRYKQLHFSLAGAVDRNLGTYIARRPQIEHIFNRAPTA